MNIYEFHMFLSFSIRLDQGRTELNVKILIHMYGFSLSVFIILSHQQQ